MVEGGAVSIYRSRISHRVLMDLVGDSNDHFRANGAGARVPDEADSFRAFTSPRATLDAPVQMEEKRMEGIVYLVGLVVIVMFVLSFLGLR